MFASMLIFAGMMGQSLAALDEGSAAVSQPIVAKAAPVAPPAPPRDPTLIEVPSNTLAWHWPGRGPDSSAAPAAATDEPLWVRSDRASADARLARARADEAELNNELLKLERTDDRYNRRAIVIGGYSYGGYRGAYGLRGGGGVGVLRGPVTVTTSGFNDAFDQAQLRFGRNATPPIIGIQNQTDQAIINARKPAVTPN